jgi:soluble lytic murein transglycosylase-like protein
MRTLILFLAAAGMAAAGEYAVLASGFRLHVDRHELDGARIRLYTGSGSIEMQANEVCRFEAEDSAPLAVPTLPSPPSGERPRSPSPEQLADAAAQKYGLPRGLVRSLIKAESRFQADVVSPKGAVGLMQLMPSTARGLGADPHDPAQNVDAGTRYLRDLLEKYNGALWHALAAYNAGPGVVKKYQGVPPYPETVNYVRRVELEWRNTSQTAP